MSFIKGKLIFDKILSKRTCYGLIWSGSYDNIPCAIKMIMLTTGIHYDKSKGVYRNGDKQVIKNKHVPEAFLSNNDDPFQHKEFSHRRSMTPAEFQKEVDDLKNLSDIGLAPVVFGYGICDKLYDIHYGFMIMERMDCSVKDIIIRRPLDSDEKKTIEIIINSMHRDHGISHGDMKPSNIGVCLDSNDKVSKCLFFDCQKVKYKRDCSDRKFKDLIKKDVSIYNRHIKQNRHDCKKGSK